MSESNLAKPRSRASRFDFGLRQELVDAQFIDAAAEGATSQPTAGGGEQFRDRFTTACLTVLQGIHDERNLRTHDSLVIGTEYGNAEAIGRLQREAGPQGRLLSAQYFPHATSSSAAAFGSIATGATGRNVTVSSGRTTPIVAAWQAMLALKRGRSQRSHLLVGDVYTPEAMRDLVSRRGGVTANSALFRVSLEQGTEFEAKFDFGSKTSPKPEGGSRVDLPDGSVVRDEGEPNPAIAARLFWQSAIRMTPSESVSISFFEREGRFASLAVTRNDDGSNT